MKVELGGGYLVVLMRCHLSTITILKKEAKCYINFFIEKHFITNFVYLCI